MLLTWCWRAPHIFFASTPTIIGSSQGKARSLINPFAILRHPIIASSSNQLNTTASCSKLAHTVASRDGAPTPKAGGGGKAVLPVPARIDAGAGAATSSVRVARKATTLPAVAAAAADAPAAATAPPGAVSNGGEEEDEDDEQVERFYALLDNIRAMRGAYVSGSAPGDGTGALDDGIVDTGGGGARAKRLRGSEPPWRPAFRLEDFEEPAPTSSSSDAARCAKKRTRGQQEEAHGGEGSGRARQDVAAAVVRVRLDSGTAKSV